MTVNDAPTPALPPPFVGVTIGIREFAAWCAVAGIDEWTAMLRLTAGDHAAMTMLRFALRWGEAEAVKAAGGWFYRSANDFANEAALTRTKFEGARKCLRTRLGMAEDRRNPQLPGGDFLLKRVNHYRLDGAILRAAFDVYCLEAADRTVCKTHAALQEFIQSVVLKTNSTDGNKTDSADDGKNDTAHCGGTTVYKDSIEESSQSPVNSSNDVSHQSGGGERDLKHPERFELPDYLGPLFDVLGTPNGKTASIIEQCELLGSARAAAVAGRCATAGSWQYVLTALQNEAKKPEVVAVIAEREREEERWRQYDADKAAGLLDEDDAPTPLSVIDDAPPVKVWPDMAADDPALVAWNIAFMQMSLQFDKATFETWVRDARLMAYESDAFVVGVRNEMTREMLQNRLYRAVARLLSDAWGQSAKVQFEVVG